MFKTIKTDLLVVGGGLSGCFAAIAAKRTSPYIQVWLVEKQGFLGGMATAGYVFPFMRYYTTAQGGGYKRLSGGLFKEMLDRAHIYGYTEEKALNEDFYSRFDPIMLRCLLDTMLLEAGVEVLFHSIVNKVNAENNIMLNNDDEQNSKRITGVIAQTKAGEIEFKPTVVIDATGDADIVYHAGGVSFSESKEHLQKQGTETLVKLHPDYMDCIRKHLTEDPARHLRLAVDSARKRVSAQERQKFVKKACTKLLEKVCYPKTFSMLAGLSFAWIVKIIIKRKT